MHNLVMVIYSEGSMNEVPVVDRFQYNAVEPVYSSHCI